MHLADVDAFFRAKSRRELDAAVEAVRSSSRYVAFDPPIRQPESGESLPLVPIVGGDPVRSAVEAEIESLVQLRALFGAIGAGEAAMPAIGAISESIEAAVGRLYAGIPNGPWSRWMPPHGAPPAAMTPEDMSEHRSGEDVVAMCFGSETSTILLELSDRILSLSYEASTGVAAAASHGSRLLGVHDGRVLVLGEVAGPSFDASDLARQANRALVAQGIEVDEETGADAFEDASELWPTVFTLDLRTGAWGRPTRSEWPLVFAGHDGLTAVLHREDGASARLFTVSESAILSPDLRWVCADGQIYDTKLATAVANVPYPRRALAFTRVEDGAFVFVGEVDGAWAVVRDGRTLFALPREPRIASFDERGERVGILDEAGILTVIHAPEGTVAAQFDVTARLAGARG